MSRITFNIAAKCDKAGRAQNQDNYWVCPNLDKINDQSSVGNDSDIDLSEKGALLVVADGMGGMKSGEKASEFVIEGIKKSFSNIPESVFGNDVAMTDFIKNAIITADADIKAYAKQHKESEGMGSTIVLLWLYREKAYCGWCGDSRIYCYNPQNNLVRLSHDHSYVQDLVDDGKITEEEAFDHPDGNIITRSLGDSGEIARPETKIYPIHRRDVFMLCSDGLCGLLDDKKLESILSDNCTSSHDALAALWKEGEKEGWSDNATIEVACVTEGGVTPNRKASGYDDGKPKIAPVKKPQSKGVTKDTNVLPNFWQSNKQYIIIIAIVALVVIGIICFFSKDKKTGGSSNQEFNVEQPEQNSNQEVETPSNEDNQNNNQQQPSKPEKPTKPNNTAQQSNPVQQPSNPSAPNQSGQQSGGNNQNQPNIPTLPTQVTQEYLNLMRMTYESIGTIDRFITNADHRRHLTSAEGNALRDFIANAQDLNSKPDVKGLNAEQQKALKKINATSKKASSALRKHKVYDEPPVQFPGRGNGNGNGNEHGDETGNGNYNEIDHYHNI